MKSDRARSGREDIDLTYTLEVLWTAFAAEEKD